MLPRYLDALAEVGASANEIDEVLAALDFGVFVDHVEKGCIYANAEVLRMFDMDWEAFRGFGWANVVLPEDMEILRDAIERYEHDKTWIEVRYRIRRPDDSIRAIHVVGKAVVGPDGEQRGSVMIGRDVTSERAMEERGIQAQKLEAIGRLAGRVAHDFNNVLTPIVCSAALLETEPLSEEGRDCVQTIHEGVRHASGITRQLLGLSRQRAYDRRNADLDVELTALQPLLAQLLGETIQLELDLKTPGTRVALAAHELGQVVLNLVINSRDAIGGDGRVTIRTSRSAPFVELIVADDGPGIPVDVQQRMFEPFFTTKSPERGTGLGLATVRDLVNRVGGPIDVRSELGRGTLMTLTMPMIATSDEYVREEVGPTGTTEPLAVLLVDDNAALRQTLAYALALRGHKVKTSATVTRATEISRDERFDVLVTDVLLGDGRGTELARHLRDDQPDMRVVYISGFVSEEMDELHLGQPGTMFLEKPFHPDRLVAALWEVVAAADAKNTA